MFGAERNGYSRCFEKLNCQERDSDGVCLNCEEGFLMIKSNDVYVCISIHETNFTPIQKCPIYKTSIQQIEQDFTVPECLECHEGFSLFENDTVCKPINCIEVQNGLCKACHEDYLLSPNEDSPEIPNCILKSEREGCLALIDDDICIACQ